MERIGAFFPELGVDHYLEVVDHRVSTVIAEPPNSFTSLLRPVARGGKRLRATMVLACSRGSALDETDERLVRCGAAIELLHLASLVHDDIVDEAELRRAVPAINAAHGVATALLCGDYLLALTFREAASISTDVVGDIAGCMAAMCEAGHMERAGAWSVDLSIDDILLLIERKTARFFRFCCELGAGLAGHPPPVCTKLAVFGSNFGMAFQFLDDLEDLYAADSADSDLRQGNFTLPVVAALAALAEPRRDELALVLQNPEAGDMADVVGLVAEGGGFTVALDTIGDHVAKATAALAEVPPELPVDGFVAMLSLVSTRAEAAVGILTGDVPLTSRA
jgi:geranylgeranyl pyrophosphate synthase